jgi:hypothetical protein
MSNYQSAMLISHKKIKEQWFNILKCVSKLLPTEQPSYFIVFLISYKFYIFS